MIILILCIIAMCLVAWISLTNGIKAKRMNVDQAKADMEVYLVKRYDVLKNSTEVAKKFASHEVEVFNNAIEARKGMTIPEIEYVAAAQEKAASGLLALAESYPELKSQELFNTLMQQVADENAHYAAAKRVYNANVNAYNKAIELFPGSVVASSMGCERLEFLKDDDADSKVNADIKL